MSGLGPLEVALTNLQGVLTMIYSLPRSEPDIIYIGLNDRCCARIRSASPIGCSITTPRCGWRSA
jgi:hypothetical protein